MPGNGSGSFMDRPRCQQLTSPARLALCILIGCLATHFLMEDSFLFSTLTAPDQAPGAASLLNLAEIEHLDDVVMPFDQPASVMGSDVSLAFTISFLEVNQARSPILRPPKAI